MNQGSSKLHQVPAYLLMFAIWLVIAALGIYEIYLIREMVLSIFARMGNEFYTAVTIGQFAVLGAGLLWVVFILASLEYHIKHVGKRKSWVMFGWTFGIEVFILILAFLLN